MSEDNDEAPPSKRPRLSSEQVGEEAEVSEKPESEEADEPIIDETKIEAQAKEKQDDGEEDSDDDLFGDEAEAPEKPSGISSSEKDIPDQPESKDSLVAPPPPEPPQQAPSVEPPVTALSQTGVPPGLPPISGDIIPTKSEVNSNTQNQASSESAKSSVPATTEVSIPRKSPSKPAPSTVPLSSAPPPNANDPTPGSVYGLPDGVMVPHTIVRNRLFETEMNSPGSKLMEILKSLPVNLINDALVEYDDAVDIKGTSAIRNHGAYLFGVVKRYVSVHERAMSGEGTGILPMGVGLTPVIEQRLEGLVSTGFCTEQEMNEKVKSKIRMLSEKDALFALDELSSVERSSIRNFGSYFMGILNRYMRGDVTSKARPRPPQSSSSSNQFGYGNNNHGHPPHRRPNDGNRPWPPQNNSMPPGGPTNHQSSYHGGPMNHGNNMSHPPHQQQYMPPQHPPHFNPHAQPPQPFGQQSPPPGYHPNNHPMHSNMPGGGGMQGHQQMQANNYQQHSNPMMGGNSGQQYGNQQHFQQQYAPQQNAEMMHQQRMPHQMNQPQAPVMGQRPPQPYGQQQQPPWQAPDAAPPVDIFGLADKAASAIQALGANKNMNQSFGQSFPPAPPQAFVPQHGATGPQYQQQPGGYGQLQGYGGGGYNQQPAMQAQGMPQVKRRTTATISDLPGTVQYAVQNLVSIGALDMLPDEGIMGMIHDLPEELALASLQKFETLDKSQMRNKTAYLAGVLRRELEKINRR